jgi:uncharacterized membrane protein
MHSVLQFLKTTIVGGVFFLLPLAVVIWILGRALKAVANVMAPIADTLPFQKVIVGFAVANILGVIAIVIVCFLAGLVGRTGWGRRIGQSAEQAILKKVPGYSILRSMTGDGTLGPGVRIETALARVEDAWVLAFIVEKTPVDGLLTVFVPSSPTPAAGTIYYLEPDRVRRIDLPVKTAVKLVMQLGVGSAELLRGRIEPERPTSAPR